MSGETEKIVKEALGGGKKKKVKPVAGPKYLNTGVTLLNLELTGTVDKGIHEGTCVLLAGDSGSGKTWLGETLLAEASIDPRFDGYALRNDDPEHGSMLLDKERYFGAKLFQRLVTSHSESAEEFYYQTDDELKTGVPFVKLLDSMDAMTTKDDQDKFEEGKKASRKGKETTGSYGTKKARTNSANLRTITSRLPTSGSILVIIAQLRTNMGYGAQFNPKVLTGGLALEYYPHYQFWLSGKTIKVKRAGGIPADIGTQVTLKIKKNRSSGRKAIVTFPLYYDTGIDDIGSCVDFLVAEKYWSATGKKQADGTMDPAKVEITATEFDTVLKRADLVKYIEETEQTDLLRETVKTCWEAGREEVRVDRKSRYS